MHLSLRPSKNAPASVLLLLTVLFTVTPRSAVHAQSPTPSQSADSDNDFDLSGFKYFAIAFAALLGFGLLCGCCSLVSSTRKTPVRDVERQSAVPSSPMQGQDAAPAYPPEAHTKEDVLSVGTTNDEEPGPPPYYPPPPFPPPMSVPQKAATVPNRGAPMTNPE